MGFVAYTVANVSDAALEQFSGAYVAVLTELASVA